jgi:hypothetical protein
MLEEEQYWWKTLKIMRATMLLLATSNGVGVNVRLESNDAALGYF